MANGGSHAQYPPGRKPASSPLSEASTDEKRSRKKQKQRSRRNSASPDACHRESVRDANSDKTPAVVSQPSHDDFLRQLELQHGQRKAKRAFRQEHDATAAGATSKKQHTSSGAVGVSFVATAAGTSSVVPGNDTNTAISAPTAAGRSAATADRAAATAGPFADHAAHGANAEEDYHTCDHMEDAETDKFHSHTSGSSPHVSDVAPDPMVTVSLTQLSTLVSNALVNALTSILPQLSSVLSPSRSADDPKVKYADPEKFTGAKGQDAGAWYEDARGLYNQRPAAHKKLEFQRWLLNHVSEPIRTAFKEHAINAFQVNYQEVQDWTIPMDFLKDFLIGINTMGDCKHRIYDDLRALKWTPKFIQQSLLSVFPILARAGGDPAFTVSGHIVVSLICDALKLQYPALYMHVFVDPETRAPYVNHVKFLKAVSLWHQSLKSVVVGNGHGNGVPRVQPVAGAGGNGSDKPKTHRQNQNPHPKKTKPPDSTQTENTQNDSPVQEWISHKGPLTDELKAEIVSAGGCIFCKRKGHVIADCERRNRMKGGNKNRKK